MKKQDKHNNIFKILFLIINLPPNTEYVYNKKRLKICIFFILIKYKYVIIKKKLGGENMEYKVIGGQLPAVECSLNAGESVYTESGGMCWMDSSFDMSTNTKGGLMKGLGRTLSGESLFMTTYKAKKDNSKIAFASSFPGKIIALEIHRGDCMIVQKNAFLAASSTIELSIHFRKKLGAGLFGGEGFILQKIQGEGIVFLEIDGDVIEKELQAGEKLKVDQGYVAMFEPSVDFDIETIKGLSNILFSGEGLFVGTLTGPGKVYLQTMPFSTLANRIIATMPSK